jgi:type I restriction enzyme, S subunit
VTWPITTLGEVATTIRNGLFARRPSSQPPGIRILRISAVRNGRVDLTDAKYVEGLTDDQLSKFTIDSGDLLVTRYNGSRGLVGTAAMVPPHSSPVVHPDKLIRIVVDPALADARFINYQLQTQAVREFLEPRIRTTAGQSGIGGADLRAIPIALPDLTSQREMVKVLEDHLSRLDAGSSYLATAARRIERWTEGSLDALIWEDNTPTVRVSDILREPMRNGRSDRAATAGEDGTRTLTLTAVTKNNFIDAYTKQTITSSRAARDLWIEPGDIFVQRANTPELVGTAARFDGPRDWAIFPDLLVRLRTNEDIADSRFLVAALCSRRVHDDLRRKAKGLAGSMPKIDQSAIGTTEVPLPSMDRQRSVVARLSDLTSAAEKLRSQVAIGQKRTLQLRRSLLAAAFTGQLSDSVDLQTIAEGVS